MTPPTPPPLSRARHQAFLEEAEALRSELDHLLADIDDALTAE